MKIKEILPRLNNYSPYVVGAILFTLPFLWFKCNYVVSGGESNTIIDPKISFYRNLYFWNSSFGFGLPNLYIIPQVYYFTNYILSFIFNVTNSQKIQFGIFLALSFFACLKMLTYLYGKKRRGAVLAGSILYVFNPFNVMMFSWVPTYSFLFMFAPFFMIYIFEAFQTGFTRFICTRLFVVSFLISVTGVNLGMFGLLFFITFLYYLVFSFDNKNFRASLSVLYKIVVTVLIANLFWLLPLMFTYESVFGHAVVYQSNFDTQSLYDLPILKSLTMNLYYWFDKRTALGNFYYEYSTWYQPLSIIVVSILLIYPVWGYVQSKNRLNGNILFFLILLVIGIYLSKGTSGPAGFAYQALLRNIKFFGIYRSSDIKFPFFVILGFSVLLTNGLIMIRSRNLYFVLLSSVLLLLSLLGSPFILGLIFSSGKQVVSVPDYWYEYSRANSATKYDYRTLLLPQNNTSFDKYQWGYEGAWLTHQLTDKSFIACTDGYGSSVQEHLFNTAKPIYSLMSHGNIATAKKYMSLFNIREILYRSDFENRVDNDTNLSIRNILQDNFRYIDSYGNLEVYKTEDAYFLPHFYIPQRIYKTDGTVEAMAAIVAKPDYQVESMFLTNNILNNYLTSRLSLKDNRIYNTPSIEFKKINPTKYRIIIHKANNNFPLVFNESFHEGWRLYLTDSHILGKPMNFSSITDYRIDSNNDDQADENELKKITMDRTITTLSSSKETQLPHQDNIFHRYLTHDSDKPEPIDYTSRKIHGVVQNNNLPDGYFYETWFEKYLSDDTHFPANIYGNGWIIDIGQIIKNHPALLKNPDGTYDFELTVEFWPQHVFSIGALITGVALLFCVIDISYYMMTKFIKIRREKKHDYKK